MGKPAADRTEKEKSIAAAGQISAAAAGVF
jgi:hypothetical protein